jgi:hypothetical protein
MVERGMERPCGPGQRGRSLDEIAENSETMFYPKAPRVEEHAEDGMNGMAARVDLASKAKREFRLRYGAK